MGMLDRLKALGFKESFAKKLYKKYKENAWDMVNETPYRLLEEFPNLDFAELEKLLYLTETEPSDYKKIRLGILFMLRKLTSDGSTCYPLESLTEETGGILNLDMESILHEIYEMEKDHLVVVYGDEEKRIFLEDVYRAERKVANTLLSLSKDKVKPIVYSISGLLEKLQRDQSIVFSENQLDTINSVLNHNVSVITGGPGTGKTTIIKGVMGILYFSGERTAICAPTGRAAKRIKEATGYNAVTIHRLLEAELADDGFTVYFRRNQNNPLELDAIIIDEGSMLDVRLMACLMDAVKKGTRIIIAGDKNQLPPVGAGNVLKDIIKSDTIPCYYLTQIYRQEKESKIVYNAHMIQEGTVPKDGGSDSDFLIYETKNHKELEKVIYDLIEQNEEYIIDSLKYQVITMTKKGPFGTVALNEKLQEKLNPMGETKKQLMEGDKIFREGDKVMQIKNNYGLKYRSFEDLTEGQGIFNGEIGIIKAVDPDRLTLDVLFSDTYYVVYEGDDLGQLELAYAITVHKSQGSEFGTIIMPLIYASKNLMTRNLIYTALTRAKDKAILVGSLKALEEMVENTREDNRNTCLSVMLQGGEDEDSGAP